MVHSGYSGFLTVQLLIFMIVPRIVHMIRNRAVWIVEYVNYEPMITWHEAQTIIFYKTILDFDYYHYDCTAKES